MGALEFLRGVLPTQGVYCGVAITGKTGPISQEFSDSIEGLKPHFKAWLTSRRNVYFALSTFKEAGSRKADNVLFTRSLFVDIEVAGDQHAAGYESKAQIIEVVDALCESRGLVKPFLVDSGYGVHAYWPFTEEVDGREWKPVAEAFKEFLLVNEVVIDRTVSADAARVLRVPRTVNYKIIDSPQAVVVLQEGEHQPFSVYRELVSNFLKKPTSYGGLLIEGEAPKKRELSPLAANLAGNETTSFKTIANKSLMGEGCAQVKYYIEHAKDQNMEPMWRGMLSLASCCADQAKAIPWLSGLHPYDQERVAQKLQDIKGPYSCEALRHNSQNPKECDTCKFKGKIVNPLMLGKKLRSATDSPMVSYTPAPQTEEEAPPPEKTPVLQVLPQQIPKLPDPYVWGKNGGIYVLKKSTVDGIESVEHELVTEHDLFFVSHVHYLGSYSIKALYRNPVDGWREVYFAGDKQAPDKLKVALDTAGIPVYEAEARKIASYMITVVKQLTYSQRATEIPAHFGWQNEGSFVYSTYSIGVGGVENVPPCPAASNQIDLMHPAGTFERWKDLLRLYSAPDAARHMAGFLSGLGSLLMRWLPERGVVVHFGAPYSGTGKSTVIYMMNSLWGEPVDLVVTSTSSGVAIQQFMGVLHDIACTVDEVATQSPQKLRGLVMEATHGKGKERLDSQARAKRNTTFWNSHLVCTSNATLSTLLEDEGTNIAPELRRIVDIPMTRKIELTREQARMLKNDLRRNYGHAGPIFVKYLVDNPREVELEIQLAQEKLMRTVDPENDERFWEVWATTVLAAIPLAQRAGVIDFDCSHAENYVYELFKSQRLIAARMKESAQEILARYINAYFNQFLVITDMGGGRKGSAVGFKAMTDTKYNTKDFRGRLEKVEGHDDATLYIEEAAFRIWCQQSKRLDANELLNELSQERRVKRNVRKKLFADTVIPVNLRLQCIEIEVSVSQDIEAIVTDDDTETD